MNIPDEVLIQVVSTLDLAREVMRRHMPKIGDFEGNDFQRCINVIDNTLAEIRKLGQP